MLRWIIALVANFVFLFACGNAKAYEIAESLQYPFSTGTHDQYATFGLLQDFNVWNSSWGGYHLGQDINASTGTKLYAIADGVVIESQNHPHSGYGSACGASGYLVIIESQLTDGTIFTALYGHVKSGSYNISSQTGLVPEGTHVSKGQYIATIADYWADGSDSDSMCGDANWDHLHFGIRAAPYDATESIRGYAASIGAWVDPENFIDSHKSSCTTTSTYYPVPLAYVSASGNDFAVSTWWQEDVASALHAYGSVAGLSSGAVKTSFSGKFTSDSLDDILTSYSTNNTRYIVVFSATS
ncbi:MAG TPA: M23 family metallopeptidase, partial [Patescibacteria group bacterium]|nr:M23 family metallopeptidase [Patescibacteria group bacterium]